MEAKLANAGIARPMIVNMRSGNIHLGSKLCFAVVTATIIESFCHFKTDKVIRYTAMFADPLTYIQKVCPELSDVFTCRPAGVSVDDVHVMNQSKYKISVASVEYTLHFVIFSSLTTDVIQAGMMQKVYPSKDMASKTLVIPIVLSNVETDGR